MPYKAHIPYDVAHLRFVLLVLRAISSIVAQLALPGIYVEMDDEGLCTHVPISMG